MVRFNLRNSTRIGNPIELLYGNIEILLRPKDVLSAKF
jgi:hypothetical protein